jgi:ATP-dependent helicase/nuclease subunit A
MVILPDTCMKPRAQGPQLYPLPRAGTPPDEVGHLVWPPTGHRGVAGIAAAKAGVEHAEEQEHHRLLYVAMTRAEDRLYICGWEGVKKREDNAWYDLIKDGIGGRLTELAGADGRRAWRMELKQPQSAQASEGEISHPATPPLPDWAGTVAPHERERPKLAPSRLAFGLEGGAEGLPPEQPPLGPLALSENNRYARGRLVHALLQHLPEVPPEDQERAARAFVAARGATLTQELRDEIVAETMAMVREASFAPLFRPGSLAEVPVVARIGAYDLEGQIDRLAEVDGSLLILDYKTNRPPPQTLDEVAPAYIAQLAGYRTALRGLFPGRTLRAALLWTDGPRLMEIPSPSLDDAERRLLARTYEP